MSDIDDPCFEQDSSGGDSGGINPADIRLAAMNFLARREHTLRELQQKLKKRFPSEDLVAVELQRLAQENLQSDARFAQSFVRERANRGYGLIRVRQEMIDRGLAAAEINGALECVEIDWSAVAQEVYRKKFGELAATDLKEKARRVRFMEYRGFDRDCYQDLLKE